ncbi:MAG TPA: hypothetical protein VFW23_11185 [Tepidisphaeraceae bacterium]|nr:hypothetical protein [Tepidisphaeraceae bacterium]
MTALTLFTVCSKVATPMMRALHRLIGRTYIRAAVTRLRSRQTALALGTVLLSFTQATIAGADNTASCVLRMSAYIADLDELLAKEKTWITPFIRLNERYFPFLDCDADPLLVQATRSRFFRHITYNPRAKVYYVEFSNGDVSVSYSYQVKGRWSEKGSAGFESK